MAGCVELNGVKKGSEHMTKQVNIPPHLYGELAKTAKGCAILKQSCCHLELLSTLRDVSQPSLPRRAAMWAIVLSPPSRSEL